MPPAVVPAEAARRLLLGAQGLLGDPARAANAAQVRKLIDALGFVQLDSINRVERAHHLTLASRLDHYRPPMLQRLLEKSRDLFEHWTHDASIIPTRWFPYWRPQFERARQKVERSAWWKERLGGDPDTVLAGVLERVRAHGPLSSRALEELHAREAGGDRPRRTSGGWWDWKPNKAALELLWHSGALSVVKRVRFEKIYDLTERVHPEAHALPAPTPEEHVAWACETALERLGFATPTELAAFWRAIPIAAARAWCLSEKKAGRLVELMVESAASGTARKTYARPDWAEKLRRLPEAPERIRLLSPFDPILRDRARALRTFGFDYRFEAFVPEPQRVYGYYVLPVLEGERLVGRVDPKMDRERGVLEIRKIWWEPGIKPTKARTKAFEAASERLAASIGAEAVEYPRRR